MLVDRWTPGYLAQVLNYITKPMESLNPTDELIGDINLNYQRLQDARAKGDSLPLQELFEQRMNGALDVYSDFMRFTLEAAGVSGGTI